MAPHLTPAELDFIHGQEAVGMSPIQLHRALARRRARQGLAAPTLPRFRLALRGISYKRSRKETRGRKAKVSRAAVLKMNAVRKRLIKKAKGQREIAPRPVRDPVSSLTRPFFPPHEKPSGVWL